MYQTTTNFYLKKKSKSMKNRFFQVKKMRISDNCINEYAHSFFGDDF